MNQLQLPWTDPKPCVRCHRHTHEHRLCGICRSDDEILTRYAARSLRLASSAFRVSLGYRDTLNWFDEGMQ